MWKLLPQRDGEERADVLLALSKKAGYRGANEEALALAETAQDIYISLGATAADADIANAYTGISYSLKQLNKTEEAIRVLNKAVDIYREDHYPYIDDLLRTKGIWHSELGDWESTLQCHLESTRVNEIDGNQEWLAKSLFNVGVAYSHLGNFTEAVKQHKEARKIFKELKMVQQVGRCDEALAEAYVELGEGEVAKQHAVIALDIARTVDNRERLIWARYNLGKAHMLLEDYKAAEECFIEADLYAVCESEIDWNFLAGLLEDRIKLFRKMELAEFADQFEARLATIREILG